MPSFSAIAFQAFAFFTTFLKYAWEVSNKISYLRTSSTNISVVSSAISTKINRINNNIITRGTIAMVSDRFVILYRCLPRQTAFCYKCAPIRVSANRFFELRLISENTKKELALSMPLPLPLLGARFIRVFLRRSQRTSNISASM